MIRVRRTHRLVLFVLVSAGMAATLHVPGEYPDIPAAISAASDGDTVLVSPGTFGGPVGFQGKNIVLRSVAGAEETVINTFSDFHAVMFTGAEDSTAVLEGFTVSNFYPDASQAGRDIVEHGGGIYINGSSPTIRNNIVYRSIAHEGGGIYATNSSALIEDCEILENTTTGGGGGGIYTVNAGSHGPLRIIGCDIHDNTTGHGIASFAHHVEIMGNRIHSNTDRGMHLGCDSALVCGNAITGNSGTNYGGGIYISTGAVTLIGNVIAENYASSSGGGIYEKSTGTVHLINNTVAMNQTSQGDNHGGGLYTYNDSIFIINSVFWGNESPYGSQIRVTGWYSKGYADISYCDIQGGLDSIYAEPDSMSEINWGPGNIDVDPEFEAGPLSDYHLAWGSPCIDAGNPSPEYYDPEDPLNPGYALWPAMGTLLNDMGAYGGGGVGYWLAVDDPEDPSSPPSSARLRVFPNPFTATCTVCFELDEASHVTVDVYDLSGRLVERVFDREAGPGDHAAWLDGSGLPAGGYVVRIVTGEAANTERCVLLR